MKRPAGRHGGHGGRRARMEGNNIMFYLNVRSIILIQRRTSLWLQLTPLFWCSDCWAIDENEKTKKKWPPIVTNVHRNMYNPIHDYCLSLFPWLMVWKTYRHFSTILPAKNNMMVGESRILHIQNLAGWSLPPPRKKIVDSATIFYIIQ